jgi:hypothetical protein
VPQTKPAKRIAVEKMKFKYFSTPQFHTTSFTGKENPPQESSDGNNTEKENNPFNVTQKKPTKRNAMGEKTFKYLSTPTKDDCTEMSFRDKEIGPQKSSDENDAEREKKLIVTPIKKILQNAMRCIAGIHEFSFR